MYANDFYKAKYQLLINKHESPNVKYFDESKAFIAYSNDLNDIYGNIDEYKKNRKLKC